MNPNRGLANIFDKIYVKNIIVLIPLWRPFRHSSRLTAVKFNTILLTVSGEWYQSGIPAGKFTDEKGIIISSFG
jgi:hypothetical protein